MTINTQGQFDSMVKLLDLLDNLDLRSIDKEREEFLTAESDFWTQCGDCAEYIAECSCQYDDFPDYDDYFDDDEKKVDTTTPEKKSV